MKHPVVFRRCIDSIHLSERNRTMKRILFSGLCLGLFAMMASGAIAKTKPSSWTGMLCDKMCSAKMTDASKCSSHPKACMTSDHCSASGYGLMLDGKFYKFDKKGNTLAKGILKNSSKDKELQVEVMGTLKGTTISVTGMKEKS